MQQLRRLLFYIRPYRLQVGLNILFNLLMALFTVVSIPAIIPFLQILFNEVPPSEAPTAPLQWTTALSYAKYWFSQFLETQGRERTLLYVCGLMISLFFFKNLFRYLSLFVMAPVRNGIVRDVRAQLFGQLLSNRLAYFTEERKGDLMARIVSDVQEIEWSILNVLEALFREPVIILSCLGYMILLSPSLTLFVFGLLLFTAFIIGGIGKTLKKSSSEAQQRLGQLMTVVEESLSGMRIIKSFKAEHYQEQQFQQHNEAYRSLLIRVLRRRDLSSPLSEFLGVSVVAILLWYGAQQVFDGSMSAAVFFSFLLAFFYIINPAIHPRFFYFQFLVSKKMNFCALFSFKKWHIFFTKK